MLSRYIFIFLAMTLVYGSASAASEGNKIADIQDLDLPTQAEIDQAIDKLPDLNAILGDFINLAKDENIRKRMEKSGQLFSEKLEQSGALEPDENGLPDIKLTLKTIMSSMRDPEVAGGVLETLNDIQTVMEKHIPEKTSPKVPD